MNDDVRTPERRLLLEREVEAALPLSTAVVETVAAATDEAVEELPPLYDAIDPDMLDRLFVEDGAGTLEFRYHGYLLSIDGGRTVSVYEG